MHKNNYCNCMRIYCIRASRGFDYNHHNSLYEEKEEKYNFR